MMKKIKYLILLLSVIPLGLRAQEKQISTNDSIVFKYVKYDFGTIIQGSNAVCKFTFTNKADEQLLLTNVKASCGCTLVTWPQKPIKTGKKGIIKVTYDTKNIGAFSKYITVNSSATNSTVYLFISGSVIPKKQ